MVLEIFSPYLKGFHLTLASHLPKRDDGGWKLTDTEWYGYVQAKLESGTITEKQAEELNHIHEKEMPSPPEEIKPVETEPSEEAYFQDGQEYREEDEADDKENPQNNQSADIKKS